jgi:hypothetical protein
MTDGHDTALPATAETAAHNDITDAMGDIASGAGSDPSGSDPSGSDPSGSDPGGSNPGGGPSGGSGGSSGGSAASSGSSGPVSIPLSNGTTVTIGPTNPTGTTPIKVGYPNYGYTFVTGGSGNITSVGEYFHYPVGGGFYFYGGVAGATGTGKLSGDGGFGYGLNF